MAIAISAKKSGTSSSTGTVAVGAAVAVNEIGQDTARTVHALIRDSVVAAGTNVELTAVSNATVSAVAIGGAGAAKGGCRGRQQPGPGRCRRRDRECRSSGCGGLHLPGQLGEYRPPGGAVMSSSRPRTHRASMPMREAWPLPSSPGAGGTGNSLAGSIGVSGAVNVIERRVIASIDDSTVIGDGDVLLEASSSATIQAFALGGAVSGASSGGTGMSGSFAGAGSGASNTVGGIIEASITDADPNESRQVTARTARSGSWP